MNTVLDALEGAKVKFSEINEPAYTGENCEFYEELLGKAIPIYKAEREVVEAALALEGNHTRLHRLSCECVAIDYNDVEDIILATWDKLQIAIDNLKEVKREN